MKSAQEWADKLSKPFRPKSLPKGEWRAMVCTCNTKEIEAIQTDARADLRAELDEAVELLDKEPDHLLTIERNAWFKRRDVFLARHR